MSTEKQRNLKEQFERTKFKHVGAYDFADKKKQLGYAEQIHCSNCSWHSAVYIPFGMEKKEYLEPMMCERCQCVGTIY